MRRSWEPPSMVWPRSSACVLWCGVVCVVVNNSMKNTEAEETANKFSDRKWLRYIQMMIQPNLQCKDENQ